MFANVKHFGFKKVKENVERKLNVWTISIETQWYKEKLLRKQKKDAKDLSRI